MNDMNLVRQVGRERHRIERKASDNKRVTREASPRGQGVDHTENVELELP